MAPPAIAPRPGVGAPKVGAIERSGSLGDRPPSHSDAPADEAVEKEAPGATFERSPAKAEQEMVVSYAPSRSPYR